MPPAVWCEDLDRNTLARVVDALPSHLSLIHISQGIVR